MDLTREQRDALIKAVELMTKQSGCPSSIVLPYETAIKYFGPEYVRKMIKEEHAYVTEKEPDNE